MKKSFKIGKKRKIRFWGIKKMKNHFDSLLRTVYDRIVSRIFKETYRMQEKDFTRNRKLKFHEIVLLILKGSKNGLRAGIQTFLKEIDTDVDTYSKAAFCKARQKIHPDAFKDLFEGSVTQFYEEVSWKRFHGYRVSAIDGTVLNLPNTAELLELFGSEPFIGNTQVQSHSSCLYDVLNHVIMDCQIGAHNGNERILALAHLEKLAAIRSEKELLVFDRGYPSEQLMRALDKKGFKYLMRCNKKEFFREVRKVDAPDAIVTRKCKDGDLTFRVISIALEDKFETLITNITDEEFTISEFKELYHLRWEIETKYDDLKNKLQLENFSGVSAICILQDFYATMFLSNAMAFLEADLTDEIEEYNLSHDNKYEYQLNRAATIAALKESFVEFVITDSNRKRKKLLRHIQRELMQCLIPIRNGRSFPRKRKHYSLKFHSNS